MEGPAAIEANTDHPLFKLMGCVDSCCSLENMQVGQGLL